MITERVKCVALFIHDLCFIYIKLLFTKSGYYSELFNYKVRANSGRDKSMQAILAMHAMLNHYVPPSLSIQ